MTVVLRRALLNTRKEQYMKKLERQVHFVAEGTSVVGCYDSKGAPVRYIIVKGRPYIELDRFEDRILPGYKAVGYCAEHAYYCEIPSNSVAYTFVKAVVNNRFIAENSATYTYAARECSNKELASFYLAMYKVQLNIIKLSKAVVEV